MWPEAPNSGLNQKFSSEEGVLLDENLAVLDFKKGEQCLCGESLLFGRLSSLVREAGLATSQLCSTYGIQTLVLQGM